jgi:hypothetical protein
MRKMPVSFTRCVYLSAAFALSVVTVLVISTSAPFVAAQGLGPTPDGFGIEESRFDESTGDKKTTPRIPKAWRFVGVSNGENANSNNLWFQHSSGNVYLVQGFTSYGKFILNQKISKINSK